VGAHFDMKCAIYIITNIVNKKQYIGISTNLKRRWRDHALSDSLIGKAIKKHGKHNFIFEHVADAFSYEFAQTLERNLIVEYNTKRPNGYNVTEGGEGVLGVVCSDETKRKISIANSGKSASLETRLKMSASHKFLPPKSAETCKKLSDALKGKKHSNEHRIKWAEKRKLYKPTLETIAKQVKSRTGLKRNSLSQEVKDKISASVSKSLIGNTRSLGFKQSEQTKEKMRLAHVGRNYAESTAKRLATMAINKAKAIEAAHG
jgi:group I intron endonuclease